MKKLLQKQEFQWVKEKLLPLFGLLNIGNRRIKGNIGELFIFPMSKENIIFNLMRITNKEKNEVIKLLKQFEKKFQNFVNTESKKNELIYYTSSPRKHFSVSRKCLNSNDLDFSSEYYVLKKKLEELSRKSIENLTFNAEEIYQTLIHNSHTINHLIILALLTNITRVLFYEKFYKLDTTKYGPQKKDIIKILKKAELDEKFILRYIEDFNYDLIYQILSYDKIFYAIIYSHEFNSGTCYRSDNLLIVKDVAQKIHEKLEKVDFIGTISTKYKKIKNKLENELDRLPLFEYKDRKIEFLTENGNNYKILNPNEPFLTFNAENYKAEYQWFEKNGFFKIKNNLITINPGMEESFKSFFENTKRVEDARIEQNMRDLLELWLNLDFNLKEEKLRIIDKSSDFDTIKIKKKPFLDNLTPLEDELKISDEIQIRGYALKLYEVFLKNPSKKNVDKLLGSLNQRIENWKPEQKNVILSELKILIETEKDINPKWKKYSKILLKSLFSMYSLKFPS